jgi:hypothetical protein
LIGIKRSAHNSAMHRTAAAIALASLLCAVQAGASEPLYVKNLGPVAGLLGLPSQRDAHTTERGKLGAGLHSSLANSYVNESSDDEFLNLDGETLRFALELRYGLRDNWDVQLEVPWLDHSGGNLDDFIDDWHDFWGMPDGGRSDVPKDVLDYLYATPAGQFGLQEDASGLGDISLSTTYAFYRDEHSVASLVLGYKFGTGDDEDFTGSGADDAFIAVRFSGDQLSGLPLSWHGQLGYLRAGDSDMMEEFQEQNLWFAGLAMDWRFAQHWSFIAQLDGHAAPLNSDLTGVGKDAVMATLGGRWYFAQHWSADFSVVEDIEVETAADVIFQFSVRYRPGDSI